VAKSPPKRVLEPPLIATSVCAALKEALEHRRDEISGKNLLVLGYGSIGMAVTRSLVEHFGVKKSQVYVFDPSRAKQEEAAAAQLRRWNRRDYTTKFALVIGCSGTRSFSVGDYVFLEDGAYLVSASSGSEETGRETFVELADSSDLDDIWIENREWLKEAPLHSDIVINLVDRKATFLNGGFPINFDGMTIGRIPPEGIQVTVAMMVRAAIQALQTRRKGLIALDRKFCRWLTDEYVKGS
jgi:threonine dehydrogenase-like Zn-dependent dehydrogenase